MVAEFRRRRDLVVSRFRQELPGIEFVEPLGAFYFFFRVDSLGGTSGTEFCTRLITQSHQSPSFFANVTRRSRALTMRSEEHTSELQSRLHLVCRLLLEKKNSRLLAGR